jgi:hypothetical protein
VEQCIKACAMDVEVVKIVVNVHLNHFGHVNPDVQLVSKLTCSFAKKKKTKKLNPEKKIIIVNLTLKTPR